MKNSYPLVRRNHHHTTNNSPGREENPATRGATSASHAVRSAALTMALLMLFTTCTTPRYIHDPVSADLQKQIVNKRAGNVTGDIFLTIGSTVLAIFTGFFVGTAPRERGLRQVVIQNSSTDSLQVNMLTDMTWKDSDYADMLDIRIPPGKKCRLLLPVNAVYNLYFSNTFDTPDDDEFLVFDILSMRKVILYPGLTLEKDSVNIINIQTINQEL